MPNASATKTRSYHHGDLRNALVREASQLVEQEGAAKLSLRGLARRLGVSHAAPAHHFAGRDELLMEIAAEGFADLADALEQALEGDDVEVQAGLAYLEVALGHPERFRLMFGSRTRAEVEPPERLRLESRRAYSALLRVARGRGAADRAPDEPEEPMQAAELSTWSLIHGATTLYLDGALPAVDSESAFRALVTEMLKDHHTTASRSAR